MLALRPIHGGDHHHQRIQLLRRLADTAGLRYDRYTGDGGTENYVLVHPQAGEINLNRKDAELYAAGYCAGLLSGAATPEDLVYGLLPSPASNAQTDAYYRISDNQRRPTGDPKPGMRLVSLIMPGVGQVVMRRDHASTFLAAFIAARAYPNPQHDFQATWALLHTIVSDQPTLREQP